MVYIPLNKQDTLRAILARYDIDVTFYIPPGMSLHVEAVVTPNDHGVRLVSSTPVGFFVELRPQIMTIGYLNQHIDEIVRFHNCLQELMDAGFPVRT